MPGPARLTRGGTRIPMVRPSGEPTTSPNAGGKHTGIRTTLTGASAVDFRMRILITCSARTNPPRKNASPGGVVSMTDEGPGGGQALAPEPIMTEPKFISL
jgi:hypothetical protein